PKHKPTYLIPLPSPHPFIQCTITPIDIFHSLLPTTIPTNPTSITSNPPLLLKNPKYPDHLTPLHEQCHSYTSQHYTTPYIRHLVKPEHTFPIPLTT
ncbi:tRNA-guanine transglycosylase, partial [Staphylococcus epidermidis]|uniref:tRNA-guanine transglycosylase n=1 Tax=Staphylococcus epidermidis TaxID=1282 RepID=UPI0011A26EF0